MGNVAEGDVFEFNIDGVKGDVTLASDPSGKLSIEGVYLSNDVTKPFAEAVGQLGPARVRKLLAAVREKYPEAKSISGERVSGARYGGEYNGVAREGSYTELPLPKRSTAQQALDELSPLIERAYARAKDEWGLSAAERIAVVEMVTAGNQRANFTGDADALVEAAITRQGIEDAIPVLAQRPVDMKPDADAADVQMRVYDERDKAVADQAEVVTNDAKKLIKQAEAWDELDAAGKRAAAEAREPGELPPDQFKLPGYDEPMSINDRIEVMNEDTGAIEEISVRELLQRQVDTDEDLKAVQSCSIR